MARSINRLNARAVATIRDPGLHADGNGLYLSVSASGAKSWRLIYQLRGQRRELGIGTTVAVSLVEARAKAIEARKLLEEGQDPKAVWRAAQVGAQTFGAVALDYIEAHESGWKNPKHRQQWRNTLATYAKPIWDRSVADVGVDDVLQILRPIWAAKPETADRVRGRIERILDAAKVRGLRSGENPAVWRGNLAFLLAKRKKGPKQHHPAMPFADLPCFMKKLAARPGLAARALELTILTAARTSEVLQAKWSEFDLELGLWVIPSARMKAGKEHRVPISEPALTLLRSLQCDSEFVFPGLKKGKPLSNMAMEMMLRRMKIEDCTVHGFRSTFRDWCGEATQFPREIAEHALAHAVGNEVERAYRRGDALEKRRELMSAWAAFAMSVRLSAHGAAADPNLNPKAEPGPTRTSTAISAHDEALSG